MSQLIRDVFFSISPKNTNFVEDIEILLPVKFRWFSGFREVEHLKRSSCFSDRHPPPPTHTHTNPTNLAEDVDILLPDKFR